MTPTTSAATPSTLDRRLGVVLHAGVLVSAVLLAAGLLLTMAGLWPEAGRALLHAGLLVLMATPMLRVAISALEYLRLRDWFFFATSFAVLLVLVATVISAVAAR